MGVLAGIMEAEQGDAAHAASANKHGHVLLGGAMAACIAWQGSIAHGSGKMAQGTFGCLHGTLEA